MISAFAGTQPIAGQFASVLTGAAIAPLVYTLVLVYRPDGWRGGLLAGLLTAVAAQLLLSSIVVMSDVAGLFWATLSALCLCRYWRQWQMRLVWSLTAVTLSLAILTRWAYGLLLLPWAVSSLLAAREARLSWKQIGVAGGTAVLIGILIIGIQFLGKTVGEPSHIVDLQVVRWQPLNAFRQVTQTSDGTFYFERPIGLYYLMPLAHPAYIFPLFFPLLIGGLLALRRQPWAATVLLVGWPLTVYLFLAGIAWQNWRFPLTLFVPLLVLVGIGFEWAWERLSTRWQTVLILYCALALLGSVAWAVRDVGNFAEWANARKETAVTIATTLPQDATLIAFDLTGTLQHYTTVNTREIFNLTETDLANIVNEETAVYLLLNPDNIQSQWTGKSPERNFTWLQTHTTLTPLHNYGRLTPLSGGD
ncbi:MAG: phospholipid carrier-dependent glycosyltransferase [Anaerolineae bacterium]|nr:phospholipid carrier-dependent glycosyltransferase [Anaerolineae bacterium]